MFRHKLGIHYVTTFENYLYWTPIITGHNIFQGKIYAKEGRFEPLAYRGRAALFATAVITVSKTRQRVQGTE